MSQSLLFHVTSREAAEAIMQEGFAGEWGDAGFGSYFFTREYLASDYVADGGWDGRLEDPVILSVLAKDEDFESIIPDPGWPNPEDYEDVRFVPMDDSKDDARWTPVSIEILDGSKPAP